MLLHKLGRELRGIHPVGPILLEAYNAGRSTATKLRPADTIEAQQIQSRA